MVTVALNQLEHSVLAGELDLCQRVGSHGRQQEVPEGTGNRHQHGVEYVPGEGHPRDVHQGEQVAEVLERGAGHDEAGRIHPQLIQRLERLHDDVQHGQEHEYAQDDQQDCDACVAARGTGKDDLVISCS